MRRVYLDNNATTFLKKEVRECFLDEDLCSNASSMYTSARNVRVKIDDARAKVASLVGCEPSEVIFTSGASEANNTVLNIAKNLIEQKKSGKILSTKIEHPAIKEVLEYYKTQDIDVILAPVDKYGVVDVTFCENELKKGGVVLTSVMSANNETGIVQPIKQICILAHKYGSLFHTDATQSLGKEEVDFGKIGADYLSCSAHKVYGPKGVGALVVRHGSPFNSFIVGGHQEDGKRAGTYNNQAVIGFGVAAELAKKELKEEQCRLAGLTDYLEKELLSRIPNIIINSNKAHRLSNTLNVSFCNIEGESLLLMMDFEGIEVSTGSACATGSLEPSYVLLAQGVKVENAHGSIRFSLGYFNTKEDIDYVLEKLPPIVSRLRDISTRR